MKIIETALQVLNDEIDIASTFCCPAFTASLYFSKIIKDGFSFLRFINLIIFAYLYKLKYYTILIKQ